MTLTQAMMSGMTDDKMPLPLEATSGDSVMAGNFTSGEPDPTTALGAAFLWWKALLSPAENRGALDALSLAPAVWGDYSEAAAAIADRSLTTFPIAIQEAPDTIAAIKFIDFGGEAAKAFDYAPLTDVWMLTVVRPAGETWFRVWMLSHNSTPTAAEYYAE